MGPLLTRDNVIRISAVGVNQAIGEVDAELFIAWVEEIVPDTGPSYDQLWAARVTCMPVASD